MLSGYSCSKNVIEYMSSDGTKSVRVRMNLGNILQVMRRCGERRLRSSSLVENIRLEAGIILRMFCCVGLLEV